MIYEVTTKDELNAAVETDEPVLLLFTDPSWCQPCRAFEPHFEKAADTLEAVRFVRVTLADADPAIAQDFNVMGVPTTVAKVGGAWYPVKARTVVTLTNELAALVS